MNKKYFTFLILSCVTRINCVAQDNFEKFRTEINKSFENFKKKTNNEYEEFRKRINDDYASMIEKTWKEFNAIAKNGNPEDKISPVPPIIYSKDDKNKHKPSPKPLPYDEIIDIPRPKPQPQPIVPIREIPVTPTTSKVSFTFFGTNESVRFDISNKIYLNNVTEQDIAKTWKDMSNDRYTELIHDCLRIRKERNLCDWAYIEMLKCLSEKLFGKGNNSATMLMAYIYCQSGYKMRLAFDDKNKLYMMYASSHTIYDKTYYNVDGIKYYTYGGSPQKVYICNASFPKEREMSLYISNEQNFTVQKSDTKHRQSKRYPEVSTTMRLNVNLIDFYNTYPTSIIGNNIVSRWAMYANTKMSDDVKEQIYPSLKKAINGCNQLISVNKLLNYVQTGFEYEYDDKVWGHDRAFFVEESLYYPYCDCEDRSILFTRLVRDLIGLDCILVYYPGHLAAAVAFTEDIKGDYIKLDNRKYIICDPTYIGAGVGITMPNMNNSEAKVILLNI